VNVARAERSARQEELLRIAQRGDIEALKLLDPTAEEINSTRDNSENPLLNVAIFHKGMSEAGSPKAKSHLELIRQLLARGADPDAKQGVGSTGNLDTALHEAAKTCDAESVAVIVAAGANPALKNKGGKTPQQTAKARRDELVARSKSATDQSTRDYVRAYVGRCDLAISKLGVPSGGAQQNGTSASKPTIPTGTVPANPRSSTVNSDAGGGQAD